MRETDLREAISIFLLEEGLVNRFPEWFEENYDDDLRTLKETTVWGMIHYALVFIIFGCTLLAFIFSWVAFIWDFEMWRMGCSSTIVLYFAQGYVKHVVLARLHPKHSKLFKQGVSELHKKIIERQKFKQ